MAGCLPVAVFSAALGMVFFGFGEGGLNAPQSVIESFLKQLFESRYGIILDDEQVTTYFGLTNTMFLIGGVIGACSSGAISDRIGRRNSLMMAHVPGLLGTLLVALVKSASSYEMLLIGRFLIGCTSGLLSTIGPLYVAEISPIGLRGTTGAINAASYCIGSVIINLCGFTSALGTEDKWPVLVSLTAVLSILQLAILPFMPESPRYLLLQKKDRSGAVEAIKKLHGSSKVQNILDEIGEMKSDQTVGVLALFRRKKYWLPLMVTICMQLSSPFSGVVGLLYYSTSFFQNSGIDCSISQYATVIFVFTGGASSYAAGFLMDKFGRRTLQLWGMGISIVLNMGITGGLHFTDIKEELDCSSGTAPATSISAAGMYLIISTLMFAVFFSVGPATVPWLITSELFGQSSRGAASSVAMFFHWLGSFVGGALSPVLLAYNRQLSFLPFGVMSAALFVFLLIYLPETNGHTPETITQLFEVEHVWQKPIGLNSSRLLKELVAENADKEPAVASDNLAFET